MTSEELARQRVIAWMIAFLICFGLWIMFQGLGWLAGGAYILLRDGFFKGQSAGKRIMGLKVVAHRDRLRCTFLDSAVRNVLWIIPVVNAVMGFTGLHDLVHDPRGRHWGDRLANTQVIKA